MGWDRRRIPTPCIPRSSDVAAWKVSPGRYGGHHLAPAAEVHRRPPSSRRSVVSRWALAKREGVVERSHALSPTQEPPPAETRIVVFLGVTTRASSITRIFPAWARERV